MLLLPYKKITIRTGLSMPEARQRIQSIVVPTPGFFDSIFRSFENMFKTSGEEKFKGFVTDTGFRLQRVIYYRNSFLPVLKGQFVQGTLGADIIVTMSLHPFVLL